MQCQCCRHAEWPAELCGRADGADPPGERCILRRFPIRHAALKELLDRCLTLNAAGMGGGLLSVDATEKTFKLKANGVPERYWAAIDELLDVALGEYREHQGKTIAFDEKDLAELEALSTDA